ncbi:MAG: hypothetical protein M1818_002991 [Claussenomyces sp. TS43310]|nr:MAG: hypothetical protein M1818_002991 [Claussenomyces sp. TS43310]
MPLTVPKYSALPIKPDAPEGSAWGVFDKEGQRDVFGTLNFITREAVVAAKQEIQTGESVVLNLPLHLPYGGCAPRKACEHHVIAKQFGMQQYYNGVPFADAAETRTDVSLGVQALSERGGIVARGVLLDFVRYAARQGIQYDPLTSYAISLSQIKEMIQDEGLTLRQGDVLIVRCGLSRWIRASTPESQGPFEANTHIGVDPTPELLEWIWDQNLAAVGGDATAFEAVPASDGSSCLPGWGMPIGELLDLEALAKVAEANNRWSFFLTVCPLNVVGGVATISNTLAVF